MVLVGGSMATKDLFYVTSEFLVSRSRPILASLFDILGDVSSLLTIGVGGVAVAQFGLGYQTWLIFLAIALGSFLGTYGGVKTGQVLNLEIKLPDRGFFRGLRRVVHWLAHQPAQPAKAGLSAQERKRLVEKDASGFSMADRLRCEDCGGIHVRACPRVKMISKGPNGERRVEYFAWGEWPTEDVLWPDELYEEGPA